MPGNADGARDPHLVTSPEKLSKASGRKRYCKKCTFTCTDAREFSTHHATHTDSDDKEGISFPPNSRIAKLKFRKPLRPKYNSKGNGLVVKKANSDRVGSRMESDVEAVSGVEDCVYKVPSPSDKILLNKNAEQNGEMNGRSLKSSLSSECESMEHSSSENLSSEPPLNSHRPGELKASGYLSGHLVNSSELLYNLKSSEHMSSELANEHLSSDLKSNENILIEHMASKNTPISTDDSVDVREKRDAVATTTTSQKKITNEHNNPDNKTLPNYVADNFSMNGDHDDNKLVIDEGSEVKISATSDQNHTYSCQQCCMTTTSARSYAHHLNNDHNIEFSIYECDFCDYATVYKQKLTLHRKLHFLPDGAHQLYPTFNPADKTPGNKINHSSLLNKSFHDSSKQDLSIKDEIDDKEDDDDCDTPSRDTSTSTTPLTITADNIDKVMDEDKKRKKKTRQEVDPGKYFEAIDSEGTKYACSQCGNIYKWRKSLNKHWKEKHTVDTLAEAASPPGMVEVLKSGKYTQLGARRIYDNIFLATIKTGKIDDIFVSGDVSSSTSSPSPGSFQSLTKVLPATTSSLTSAGVPLIPKMIGPFVCSTAQPVFPGMPMMLPHLSLHSNGSPEEGVLDLSRESKPAPRISPYPTKSAPSYSHNISLVQDEPLDFSRSSKSTGSSTPEMADLTSHKPTHSRGRTLSRQLQCSKCDFACSCEPENANHMSSNLNKRIFRCFECKLQLTSMDELNSHFIKLHFQKLSDHKEAIKKIPHGLQQAYHVLNMNIHDIGELGNQDLGATEGKSLKCNKCNFEAKWPAELQKHAVSHSEERPYVCMVCGSTYKWKWDLVKHFQKSHPDLPNPYRRNDKKDTADESSEDECEPPTKRQKLYAGNDMNGSQYSRDDAISVEGIIAATQTGQALISSQPNILDDDPVMQRNLGFLSIFPATPNGQVSPASEAQRGNGNRAVKRGFQDTARARYNSLSASTRSSSVQTNTSSGSSPGSTKSEEFSYKCTQCNYHARWPSEVTQHMKNHSDCKPYMCPKCGYRSKWKWDVVKHMKRCMGGGSIEDVIDLSKPKRRRICMSDGPPNVVVSKDGKVKKQKTQQPLSDALPSMDDNVQSFTEMSHTSSSGNDLSRPESRSLMQDQSNTNINTNNNNNKDSSANDNNVNNKYQSSTSGLPFTNVNLLNTTASSIMSTTTAGNIIPASNPSYSSRPSSVTQTNSSRHSSSGQIWNCLHCPFTTPSQAELKRHSDLHSDDKPFKCDMCQYSTRWACDLKKHRKSYNHYPKTNTKDAAVKTEKPHPRFKCSQCVIFFETFDNLLQHRQADHVSHGSSQTPTAPQTEIEIDVARIKHPRKRMKQFQCPKCPFLCKTRQTMAGHMNEHEQLELSGINCFYCSCPFKDKESLLDHITTHSAFNPKEWETFFMISEEEHLLNSNKTPGYRKDVDNSQHHDIQTKIHHDVQTKSSNSNSHQQIKDNSKDPNSTEARIKQILNEIPKEMKAPQQKSPYSAQFKCEWCPAEFVNLTSVYKHASQSHPIQLREQDVDTSISDDVNRRKMQPDQPFPAKKPLTGEAIDILKQQVKEKRTLQQTEKHVDSFITRIEENENKKSRNGKDSGNYNCDKCSFSSSNFITFQNHCDLHGDIKPSHCWFCDFNVDQLNLLYQHMKISHTRKWKALSQNSKYASHIRRINLAFAGNGTRGNGTDNNPSGNSQNAADLSLESKTPPSETADEIIYITRQQYTWSKIPVNIVPIGTALTFVCPHCTFNDVSITNTCNHVMHCHQAMSKFTCKKCQYSNNNIRSISEHCQKEHPPSERIVEVIDFKQINFSELQVVNLNAIKDQIAIDFSKKDAGLNLKSLATKTMSCPFCPFKTVFADHMKAHVSDHTGQGSYQCHLCDYSSDFASVIMEHVKVHETDYLLDSRSVSATKSEVKVKDECINTKMEALESKFKISRTIVGQMEVNRNGQEEMHRSRTGKKIRYRCSVCPYHSICRSNMVKHRRQHNNSKKYKCSQCSYGAARAVLLKNHIDSHKTPVSDEGNHHDIFCDPNNPDSHLDHYDNDSGETEMENDDDDADSDDIDEMDAKAIADLEAKDILEAESALKASTLLEDDDSVDKAFRKQKCPQCPFSSISGSELRKHLHYHDTQERYKCDLCSYSLDRLNLLSQHRRLHVDEPGYIANPPTTDLLNTNFILQQSAETGSRVEPVVSEEAITESSLSPISCKLCPYKAFKKKPFEIHCAQHGCRKFYICDFCDWSADRIGLLHQHRRVHQNEPLYNPKPEDKIFMNQEFDVVAPGEFEAKFMEVKDADKVNEGQRGVYLSPPFKLTVVKKSYPCKQCPFKSNSKNSYFVHKSMHNSGSDFACSRCSYSSTNRGLLQQHLHLHASNPYTSSPVRGNLTKQEVPDLEAANEHDETVSSFNNSTEPQDPSQFDIPMKSELKCQRCPFTALSHNSLVDHIKGHINQESFKCPYCDFSATSRQVMFPHIQIHFPGTNVTLEALEEHLMDEQAKKMCSTIHNLNNNNPEKLQSISPKLEKMPPGEEPAKMANRVYICQFCEREFEAKQLLIQHEKQHLVGSQ